MKFCLIIYSSITPANAVKRYFEEEGYTLTLMHTPLSISSGGCSYCLKVRRSMVPDVQAASKAIGARVKGIYEELRPGVYQEVLL